MKCDCDFEKKEFCDICLQNALDKLVKEGFVKKTLVKK